MAANARAGSIRRPVSVKGASIFHKRFSMRSSPSDVSTVNINIIVDVDTVNTYV
jgi:hypothetical protein